MAPSVYCHRRRKHDCEGDNACTWRGQSCRKRTKCSPFRDQRMCAQKSGCVWCNRSCQPDGSVALFQSVQCPVMPRRVVSYSLFWGRAQGRGYKGMNHTLAAYQHGLFRAVVNARKEKWGVRVYHDGSVEKVLRRFRVFFPPHELQCIHVLIPPSWSCRRYVGCLLRLLPADDQSVDVFLCRDLDDQLSCTSLQRMEAAWLMAPKRQRNPIHVQAEPYHTVVDGSVRRNGDIINLGWFGQINTEVNAMHNTSMAECIVRYISGDPTGEYDYYTADEEFVTDIWVTNTLGITAWKKRGACKLPSIRLPLGRRTIAYRQFLATASPKRCNANVDAQIRLGT